MESLVVIAGLGHGAGVELAGAIGGADEGPDDALEVDLHRFLG